MLKEKERNDVWKNWHHFMLSLVCTSKATVVLFGDSIMKHLGDRKVNHDTWQLSVQEESLFLAQGGGTRLRTSCGGSSMAVSPNLLKP